MVKVVGGGWSPSPCSGKLKHSLNTSVDDVTVSHTMEVLEVRPQNAEVETEAPGPDTQTPA